MGIFGEQGTGYGEKLELSKDDPPEEKYKKRIQRWESLHTEHQDSLRNMNPKEYSDLGEELTSKYDPNVYNIVSRTVTGAPQSNEQVLSVQRFLKETGYYEGELDGMYGKLTIAAYDTYADEHSGTDVWNRLKGTAQELFSPFREMIGF